MKEVVTFSCGEVVGIPSSDVVGVSSIVVAAGKVVGVASTPAFFNRRSRHKLSLYQNIVLSHLNHTLFCNIE